MKYDFTKIALAIIEHKVKGLIGDDAIQEIKKPVIAAEFRKTLNKAVSDAENRFLSEYNDVEIRDAIKQLPLASLPSIQEAIQSIVEHPTDRSIHWTFREQFNQLFPLEFPKQRIETAINAYLKILREELLVIPTLSARLNVLANQETATHTAKIVEILTQINDRQIHGNRFNIQAYARSIIDSRQYSRWSRFFVETDVAENYVGSKTEDLPFDFNFEVVIRKLSPHKIEKPSIHKEARQTFSATRKNHPKLLLLGDPGSGKTTTLHWLALKLASDIMMGKTAPLPVYIPLNRYRAKDGGLNLLINEALHVSNWRVLAEKVTIIFLLDGINEVPQTEREDVLRDLAFLIDHPNHECLLTSRRTGYDYELDVYTVEMLELTDNQTKDLILRYIKTEDREANARKLFSELSTDALSALAKNPLLLTMIVGIYNFSGMIPPNKGLLFGGFIEAIYSRESKKGKHTLGTYKTDLLAYMAFTMIKQYGTVSIPIENCKKLLSSGRNKLIKVGLFSNSIPATDTIYNELIDNNLIIEHDKIVEFPHQLFQEYFAAVYLRNQNWNMKFKSVTSFAPLKWWNEVMVMLSGMEAEPDKLVRKLLDLDIWLAARCAVEGAKLSENNVQADLVTKLLSLARRSSPENREKSVRYLGMIRDKRAVPRLIDIAEKENNWLIRLRIIEAIGKISDQRSLDFLANVALNDTDWSVRRAAAEALGKIDNKEAVKQFIKIAFSPESSASERAIYALGKLQSTEAVDSLIEIANKALEDSSWSAKFIDQFTLAIYALGKIKGSVAENYLISQIKPIEPKNTKRSQFWVGYSLGKMKSQKAEQILKENLEKGLAYGISYASYIAGATRAVEEEGGNFYTYFRNKVQEFPINIKNETISFMIDLWSQMAESTDESPYVRERALDALALVGTERAIQTIINELNDPLDHMRHRAAFLLGQLRYEKSVDNLLALLGDTHDHVRNSAGEALLIIGGSKLKDKLVGLTKEKNPTVQATAMRLLEKINQNLRS
jgi:HEAT repeat protein